MARWILLLSLALGCLVGCGSQSIAEEPLPAAPQQTVDNDGPLRVGMFTEFEPMVFAVSGEIQGIEVDFASLVADALDRPLAVKTYRFPELIGALESGDIDVIMSGFSVTPERQARVRYAEPYMEIGQMAIVRAADAGSFTEPNALATPGLKIGVHQGSTGEDFVRGAYRDAAITAYGGVESGLTALREGAVDVFVHDSTTSWQLGRSFINDNLVSLNQNLTRESIAWAVNQDNPELQAQLTRLVQQFRSEGTVDKVLARWLPVVPTPANP